MLSIQAWYASSRLALSGNSVNTTRHCSFGFETQAIVASAVSRSRVKRVQVDESTSGEGWRAISWLSAVFGNALGSTEPEADVGVSVAGGSVTGASVVTTCWVGRAVATATCVGTGVAPGFSSRFAPSRAMI